MSVNEILIPALVIAVLGAVFALVLAVVSKYFATQQDPKIEELADILPGLNCGGCGFPSCSGYAEALAQEMSFAVNMCKPGGAEVAQSLAFSLGRDVQESEKVVAKVFCNGGGNNSHDAFVYCGEPTCKGADLLRGGNKVCKQGCLGFGDCVLSCDFGAIRLDENHLPVIDPKKCIACGACLEACPKSLISLVPEKSRVFVQCKNNQKAAVVLKACDVGCIACSLCVKACPFDAISIIDNVAVVDYSKCVSCGKCVSVCPRKIILQIQK